MCLFYNQRLRNAFPKPAGLFPRRNGTERDPSLAEKADQSSGDAMFQKIMKDKQTKPHLYNLNFDPQLSGRIIHILEKPETVIGSRKVKESDIRMLGPG